jgi:predicted amidohydrolase
VALRECRQRCVYCATPLATHTATLDHVHPLARGGAHEAGNLVAACARCNRLKGDQPPHEFFARHPWAGRNFLCYARTVHRALKRIARRAVSLAGVEEMARRSAGRAPSTWRPVDDAPAADRGVTPRRGRPPLRRPVPSAQPPASAHW